MLTCREMFDFLMSYDEGELPDAQREAFDEHLAACPDCVDYLATYRRTQELSASLAEGDDAIPPDVPDDLVRAILDARRRGA